MIKLETYHGLYIDLSDLTHKKIDSERSIINLQHKWIIKRFIYSVGSFLPPSLEELEIRQRERSVLRGELIMKWSDQQRAELLQIYKQQMDKLGEEEFFARFDEIREEAYKTIGVESRLALDEVARQKGLDPTAIREKTQREIITYYSDPVHSSAATLGRLGGKAKSEAKSLAVRENGKKGGRPKKQSTVDINLFN